MYPVESTYQIVVLKVLNRSIDKTWIDWAYQMLQAGFSTENLIILAGETPPYNQFELQTLTSKVLDELTINYSDKLQAIKNYSTYLIQKAIKGEIDSYKVLGILKEYYYEIDENFRDFYFLYFAKHDLLYSDDQYYWNGADKNNIDQIIIDCFKKWIVDNKVNPINF